MAKEDNMLYARIKVLGHRIINSYDKDWGYSETVWDNKDLIRLVICYLSL